MSRGSVDEKGRLLLTEGRLTLRYVEDGTAGMVLSSHVRFPIVAECRGDSGRKYALGFDRNSFEWYCECPARGRCSHLIALQLVTLEPKPGPGGTLP